MSINSLEREFETVVKRIGDGNVRMAVARVGLQFVGELKRMDKELKELQKQVEALKGD
ncbi:hypothetical protein [Brucella intermedia]|uniref:hypothetical protein n=1 Tax=Brucella intermedia TaxID=94625 RepID=UPI000AC43392|nr:hypothetical protein [Brucella intermedia]